MRSPTLWLVVALLLSVALCLVHASLHLAWTFRDSAGETVLYLGNLTSPGGLHSWLSVITLAALGWVCLLLGREKRRRPTMFAGVFFLLLALDDAFEFHEAVGRWLSPLFSSGGIYAWVLVLGPLLVLIGILAFWHFWWLVGTGSRRLLIFLGFFSMGLALLIEGIEGDLHRSDMRVRGISLDRYMQVPEEFLEFFGAWLLLLCFVRELQDARASRHGGGGAASGPLPPPADTPTT